MMYLVFSIAIHCGDGDEECWLVHIQIIIRTETTNINLFFCANKSEKKEFSGEERRKRINLNLSITQKKTIIVFSLEWK